MNLSATSTPEVKQAAGVAAQVDDERPHAVAVQLPQGLVDVVAGRLLEASQLEVADAEVVIDNFHIVDARHIDMLRGESTRPRRLRRR